MGNEVSANFELFNNAAENNQQFIADELKWLLAAWRAGVGNRQWFRPACGAFCKSAKRGQLATSR